MCGERGWHKVGFGYGYDANLPLYSKILGNTLKSSDVERRGGSTADGLDMIVQRTLQ